MLRGRVSPLVLALSLAGTGSASAHIIWHVDENANPGGNGLTWNTAFQTVQEALVASHGDDHILIAAGRYRPDLGGGHSAGDRDASFLIGGTRELIGGYRGLAGGGNPDDRDPLQFVTILSGDLAGDDPGNTSDNSKRIIVVTTGLGSLEGIVVEGGHFGSGSGAGVDVGPNDLIAVECSFRGNTARDGAAISATGGKLEFIHCNFERNEVRGSGAALRINQGSATFTVCTLTGNVSTNSEGGAMFADGANLQFFGCGFSRNSAFRGGALSLHGSTAGAEIHQTLFHANSQGAIDSDIPGLSIDQCHFQMNTTTGIGGGVTAAAVEIVDSTFIDNRAGSGGALFAARGRLERCRFLGNQAFVGGGAVDFDRVDPGATVPVIDCAFVDNAAPIGAALLLGHSDPSSRLELHGATVAGNSAIQATGAAGSAVRSDASNLATLDVRNTIIYLNSPASPLDESTQISSASGPLTINHSTVMGWSGALGGVGNDGDDPRFVDPSLGDFRLNGDSPAIDSADPAFLPLPGDERDLDGNVRLTDGNLDLVARLDRGAFEFANVRLDVVGDLTPGGFLEVVTSGTPGLPTLLVVGTSPAVLELLPRGYLFVDPGTISLCVPWPSAPSRVHFGLPSNLPRTTLVLQEFASQGVAGNLSNGVTVDIR